MTEQVCVKCSCGGTTTVNVGVRESTAVVECVCGRIAMWSRQEAPAEPKMLGIAIGENVRAADKFGG